MPVHVIHVSKSGGSALRYALREARRRAGGGLVTPWGPIWGHDHGFGLRDVGRNEKVFFAVRDPLTRFLSGFYSRRRNGAPRYSIKWTENERQAFEWFATPQALADALAGESSEMRRRAEFAMGAIGHLKRPITFWTGSPSYLRRNLDKVIYVARQETLASDWEQLKELLDIPRDQTLPEDPVIAHRGCYDRDTELSPHGAAAVRAWYADDYRVLEVVEEVRQRRAPEPRFEPLRSVG
jgi:hypothetical protein